MYKLTLLFACLALSVTLSCVSALRIFKPYESYLCAAKRNFTSGLLSCSEDCQLSHGAVGGACLDVTRINRYNCICGEASGQLPWREQQCIEDNEGYRELCQMDCRCNHGAFGGTCNFRLKSCFCDGQGQNPINEGCPARNYAHFLMTAQVLFKTKTGLSGPSWLYDPV